MSVTITKVVEVFEENKKISVKIRAKVTDQKLGIVDISCRDDKGFTRVEFSGEAHLHLFKRALASLDVQLKELLKKE